MINNRQAGRRNRGRNNNGRPNGGGNGRDNGNRIDNRSRGNAAQLLEKYKNMARDAQTAGDRVNMEYYLQFADHYFRVLADNRARQDEQQQRHRRPGENFEDEAEDFEGVEDGVDDIRGDVGYGRTSQDQGGQERQERQERQDRQERRPQQDRAGQERGQDGNRGRGDRDRFRRDRPERQEQVGRASFEPVPGDENSVMQQPVQAVAEPSVEAQAQAEAVVEAPRPRRGRPRKSEATEAPEGLDAAVLPPAIGRADNDSQEAEAPPPRRTRRPRAASQAAE